MKNKTLLLGILMFSLLITLPGALAHCPLCTAAAGAGVATARFYGLDDSISGLFLGALITSSALWFNRWLKKKKVNYSFQEALILGISFLATAIPFHHAGLITDFEMVKSMPAHHSFSWLGVWGIDKLLFGIILGTIITWATFTLSNSFKEKKGKVFWPYQSLSLMILILGILSLTLWLFTK